MAHPPLIPTFWRTCRVLANSTRLTVLKVVIESRQAAVQDVARALGLSETKASAHLRLLQSRGLLQVARAGRWAYYRASADPSVGHAAPMLAAAAAALRAGRKVGDLRWDLTAFTHGRRIQLVQALRRRQPATAEALMRDCGVSLSALYRHLDKLERRRVVAETDGLRWALLKPANPFARALREIVAPPA